MINQGESLRKDYAMRIDLGAPKDGCSIVLTVIQIKWSF